MSNSAVDRRVLWNQLPELVMDYSQGAARQPETAACALSIVSTINRAQTPLRIPRQQNMIRPGVRRSKLHAKFHAHGHPGTLSSTDCAPPAASSTPAKSRAGGIKVRRLMGTSPLPTPAISSVARGTQRLNFSMRGPWSRALNNSAVEWSRALNNSAVEWSRALNDSAVECRVLWNTLPELGKD